MEEKFLELYEALTDDEKSHVVYKHPTFDVDVTWNDVKKAIDDNTPLAKIALLAFVNAGIIKL